MPQKIFGGLLRGFRIYALEISPKKIGANLFVMLGPVMMEVI